MKNLKRALSLTMASTMLVSMMATGASAAVFPDADEISNLDAVSTLVALNIINGKDDGTFDPSAVVTRGELAKMICVALNGGKDPNLTGGGLYSDTIGHWASGYIDYCTNLGIVSGYNGTFRPNDTVTGVEAAKMLLIAMGFNSEDEGYINSSNWDLNINIDAISKNLYDGLSINPSAGLSRDDAAQMILNGINADMVKYDYRLTTVNGNLQSIAIAEDQEGKTILTEKFKAETEEGVLINSSYNETKDTYTYTVSTDDGNSTYTAGADFSSLFGMNVNVFYKSATNEAYGMYAYNTDVAFEGIGSDISDFTGDEVELGSETFALSDDYLVVGFNDYDTTYDLNDVADQKWEITAIDNTDNGELDVIVVLPYEVVEVTFVGTTNITITGGFVGTVSVENDTYPEDIEAGDVLKLILAENTVEGNHVLETMEVVEGTVTSRTGTSGAYKYRINGTWYTCDTELTLGGEYTCYVVGTHVFASGVISEGVSIENILFLSAAIKTSGLDGSTYTARVYFMDGTSEVVTLSDVYESDGKTDIVIDATTGSDFNDFGLYTFKVSSGHYELTAVGTDNTAGFDYAGRGSYVKDGRLDNGFYVSDTAIVVAIDEDGDLYFLTGEDVNNWDSSFGTSYFALANEVNGLESAEVIYITGNSVPGIIGTETYGYVTSDVTYQLDTNGDGIYTFDLWTANGYLEAFTYDAKIASKATIGATISFEIGDDNEVFDIISVGDLLAVTAFSSTILRTDVVDKYDELSGVKNDYTLNSDTSYIYVNTDTMSGVEGGSLRTATQYNSGKYYSNVVVVEDDGVALAVFIDVNNKFEV